MKPKTYSIEDVTSKAKKYTNRRDFVKNSPGHYAAAKRFKILETICMHMPKRHGKPANFIWTKEKIKEEALKFNARNEFKHNSPAYKAAFRENILDEVCSHMQKVRKDWDEESLKLEALKYSKRGDFFRNSKSAYITSKKIGIFDSICEHMGKSGNASSQEYDLMNIVSQKFPKAQKFIDGKVRIPNKSHIDKFEIDIYIPELRKGIEFDGKFHHSPEGLRRGRPNWPEEDILNYHEIKDSYFKSKGIEILHITEQNWLLDKNECFNKIWNYLK